MCFLYFYGIIQQTIPFELAIPKIFLHGIVVSQSYILYLQLTKKMTEHIVILSMLSGWVLFCFIGWMNDK